MCSDCGHTIHGRHKHYGWDNSISPVRTIAPGTTLGFECNDAANGHFGPESTVADVATLDFSKVNPVTGPVFIDGAEPGDAVKITFGDFTPSGRGGRRTSRASGCSPTSSPSRRCTCGATRSARRRSTGRGRACR